MTRTELLTNLISTTIDNKSYLTVDAFRQMFINHLPGQLTFLAFSNDGNHVLPLFENLYNVVDTDLVDYKVVRETLGKDWTPVVSGHVWNRFPGQVPMTMLGIDGIMDEKVLHTIFNTLPTWSVVPGMVQGMSFGMYDVATLPALSIYTVDVKGARRIHTLNNKNEGKVFGLHLDVNGMIRYLEPETLKTVYARFDIGLDTPTWKIWE